MRVTQPTLALACAAVVSSAPTGKEATSVRLDTLANQHAGLTILAQGNRHSIALAVGDRSGKAQQEMQTTVRDTGMRGDNDKTSKNFASVNSLGAEASESSAKSASHALTEADKTLWHRIRHAWQSLGRFSAIEQVQSQKELSVEPVPLGEQVQPSNEVLRKAVVLHSAETTKLTDTYASVEERGENNKRSISEHVIPMRGESMPSGQNIARARLVKRSDGAVFVRDLSAESSSEGHVQGSHSVPHRTMVKPSSDQNDAEDETVPQVESATKEDATAEKPHIVVAPIESKPGDKTFAVPLNNVKPDGSVIVLHCDDLNNTQRVMTVQAGHTITIVRPEEATSGPQRLPADFEQQVHHVTAQHDQFAVTVHGADGHVTVVHPPSKAAAQSQRPTATVQALQKPKAQIAQAPASSAINTAQSAIPSQAPSADATIDNIPEPSRAESFSPAVSSQSSNDQSAEPIAAEGEINVATFEPPVDVQPETKPGSSPNDALELPPPPIVNVPDSSPLQTDLIEPANGLKEEPHSATIPSPVGQPKVDTPAEVPAAPSMITPSQPEAVTVENLEASNQVGAQPVSSATPEAQSETPAAPPEVPVENVQAPPIPDVQAEPVPPLPDLEEPIVELEQNTDWQSELVDTKHDAKPKPIFDFSAYESPNIGFDFGAHANVHAWHEPLTGDHVHVENAPQQQY